MLSWDTTTIVHFPVCLTKMLLFPRRKRQINKPRPVSVVDMEAIFRQAKEEQEKTDRAFEESQRGESLKSGMLSVDSHLDPSVGTKSVMDSKPKKRIRKASDPLTNGSSAAKDYKLLVPGSSVRVVSGTFAEFVGSLKKLNRKSGKVCYSFSLIVWLKDMNVR